MDGCPEVEWIAVRTAGEAAIDLAGKVDGEGVAGPGRAAGNWAGPTKLIALPACCLEAEQIEHLRHRDLLSKAAIVDARHDEFGDESLSCANEYANCCSAGLCFATALGVRVRNREVTCRPPR